MADPPSQSDSLRLPSLLRWVGSYVWRRWRSASIVLVALLLQIAVDVLRPWPMKVLVDHVLGSTPMPGTLERWTDMLPVAQTPQQLVGWCTAATLLVFLLGWFLRTINAMAGISLGQRLSYDVAADLFRHVQSLSLRFHHSKSVGDSIRRVLTDSGCISTIVKDALIPVIASIVSLIIMFTILWRMNMSLALISLCVVPLMVLAFRLYAKPMVDTSYAQHDADGRIYEVVERHISSIPAVQAFVREAHAEDELRGAMAGSLRAALVATDVQLKFKILIGLSTAAGTSLMFYIGARAVMSGTLTVGELLVFLAYLSSLYNPLETLAYTSSTVQSAMGSARRVLELLGTEREVPQHVQTAALQDVRGDVSIEQVTVGYDPSRPVLNDVSVSVRAGESLAIVGSTGAGKSTLVSLIPRFIEPWSGRVTVDGSDLRELDVADLRRQISLVLQEPFLFPTSIAENIGYGRPDATMAEIESAARAANAHGFITRLPDGYESIIGERGATLSGGEWQRISIARALLKDAPILILDEPTSALDTRTEALLLEALDRLKANRTTFIIAHRLSTIRNADRIIAMDAGRIVEVGTHAELLVRNGVYAKLYRRQFQTPDATASSMEVGA